MRRLIGTPVDPEFVALTLHDPGQQEEFLTGYGMFSPEFLVEVWRLAGEVKEDGLTGGVDLEALVFGRAEAHYHEWPPDRAEAEERFFGKYRAEHEHKCKELARRIEPTLREVMARKSAPRSLLAHEREADAARSLMRRDGGLVELWEVVDEFEEQSRGLPSGKVLGVAFRRLKERGWLREEGGKWGLTPLGLRSLQDIDGPVRGIEVYLGLMKWLRAHPPGERAVPTPWAGGVWKERSVRVTAG